MVSKISISTSDERLRKIDSFLKKTSKFQDRSSLINKAIDFYFQHIETKSLSDFIYYIGLPSVAFIACIFLTFYLTEVVFFILSAVIGIYLIILGYLYNYKYRGKIWQKE